MGAIYDAMESEIISTGFNSQACSRRNRMGFWTGRQAGGRCEAVEPGSRQADEACSGETMAVGVFRAPIRATSERPEAES